MSLMFLRGPDDDAENPQAGGANIAMDMVKILSREGVKRFPLSHVESCGNELRHLPHTGRKTGFITSSLRRALLHLILIHISVTKICVLAIESVGLIQLYHLPRGIVTVTLKRS